MFAGQNNNQVNGSMAGRDINTSTTNNHLPPEKTHISRLYDQLKAESQISESQNCSDFIEDLQHFMGRAAVNLQRSLAQKLTDANRGEMATTAEEAKERAAKKILKFQSSRAAQEIFAYILGQLHNKYTLRIRPLIAAGATRAEVDRAIDQDVITPLVNSMEPSSLSLGPSMVLAMLYYLAGNCYVEWD